MWVDDRRTDSGCTQAESGPQMKDPDLTEFISESTLQAVDYAAFAGSIRPKNHNDHCGECACGRHLSLKSEKLSTMKSSSLASSLTSAGNACTSEMSLLFLVK